MLPIFIFWLIKQFGRKQFRKIVHENGTHLTALFLLAAFISCSFKNADAQQRILKYNIMHNGECKGSMVLTEENKGKVKHIKIESDVKVRFILSFKIHSVEEAIFEDGVLVYSLLYRTINGDEKLNQQLQLNGSVYKITCKGDCDEIPAYPVHNTILSLYCFEPINVTTVYSDSFRKYVTVERKTDGVYKVALPNGNTNFYSYKDGVCVKVDVQQSFYPVQFIIIK
jgi:hypothetical protein